LTLFDNIFIRVGSGHELVELECLRPAHVKHDLKGWDA